MSQSAFRSPAATSVRGRPLLVFVLFVAAVVVAALVVVIAAPPHAQARAAPAEPSHSPPAPEPPVRSGERVWPLAPRPAVTRRFEPPPTPYSRGHRGVDLAGSPGQTVLAAGPGTVVYAGILAGRGVVSIDHPSGLRTTYEPVNPSVTAGNTVTRGQAIGTLEPGHVGCPDAACLHWGLRRGRTYLDPLTLLVRPHIRLKPLHGSYAAHDRR